MSQVIHSIEPLPHSDRFAGKRRSLSLIRRAWGRYAALLALYTLVFSFWQTEPVPLTVHFASIVLMAVCLVPITVWRVQGSQGPPMFELICLAYALEFAMPVYLQTNDLMVLDRAIAVSWSDVAISLLLTTLGVSSMIAGYYVIAKFRVASRFPKLDLPLDPRKRVRYLRFAVVVGLGLALLQAVGIAPDNSGPLGAFVRILTNQLNLAIIVLGYEIYRNRDRRRRTLFILYGITLLAFLLGLSSGMLEGALIPFALLFIVRWHATKKIAWRVVIVAAAVFVLLNPVKVQYRSQAWFGGENVSLPARLSLWFDLAKDNLSGNIQDYGTSLEGGFVQNATSRLDLIHRFAYVHQMTPRTVPFYRGSTYGYLIYGWIPRIVWPSKPAASDASHQMDVDYGFLYDNPGQTGSIGIGQLPEAWVNFGALGIVAVLFVQGALLAILSGILTGPRSEGGQAIYLSIMVSFLNGIGSVVVIFFTSLLQNTVANALVLRPFSPGFKARKDARSYWRNQ